MKTKKKKSTLSIIYRCFYRNEYEDRKKYTYNTHDRLFIGPIRLCVQQHRSHNCFFSLLCPNLRWSPDFVWGMLNFKGER